MESFKYGVFSTGQFSWLELGYSAIIALILCLLGLLMFKHKEKTFIDTI